jgi:CHAT domain-containing protein
LYASLIDLMLQQHKEFAAVELLDRARAANLLEHVGTPRGAKPAPLPDGTVALEYAVLPSGISGWMTAGNRRERFGVPLSAKALGDLVDAYRAAILRRADGATIRRLSVSLFEALCGPARDQIAGAAQIVVVPDGPLHALPFASLQDPRTGAVLVEHAAITITPSLALYRVDSHVAASRRRYDAVVVGNPNRANSERERFPSLPGAEREAHAVAALYRGAHLLTGASATRRAFLDAAPHGRVIHVAGHALVDERQPDLSRLLVSPSADDAIGAVFARDLSLASLEGVRLVILSACDTARGRTSRGEGVIGLARAFLSAGASSVIATLWPVDDERAFDLALTIHKELIRGRSAAEALRAAQLRAIRSGRTDVVDWAASIVIGRDVVISDQPPHNRSHTPWPHSKMPSY